MKILAIILFLPLVVTGDILSLIEDFPDSATNEPGPCQLTVRELDDLIRPSSNQVVGSQQKKYVLVKTKPDNNEQFVSASRIGLANLGYQICTVPVPVDATLLPHNVTVVFEPGRLVPYHGRRDPATLIRFVAHLEQRLSQTSYQTIENKMDKKAYEHVLEPKVVAYFPDVTAPGFQEFQAAARQLSPNPPFFVVHNPLLAAKFHLFQPGQLSLVRRLEKSRIFFPSATGLAPTAQEIVDWIYTNRGLVLHELTDMNLYDPEIHDPNKYLFVAVGDKQSPLGLYFFKILTKTVQNISRENEMKLNPMANFADDEEHTPAQAEYNSAENPETVNPELIRLDDIEIVWIDTQKFPNAAFNLKNRHQIETVKNVWFGLIQAPAASPSLGGGSGIQSAWMDINSLDLTRNDRIADETNIGYLRYWILAVADRWTGPEPGTVSQEAPEADAPKQEFILEPEPVSVRNGGNFLLECQIRNRQGRCGWLKDGQSVPVGDVDSPYRYVSAQNSDDCTVTVNGADVKRDSGEWSCYVTDATGQLDQQNGAIVSKPVTVQVRTGKAEL